MANHAVLSSPIVMVKGTIVAFDTDCEIGGVEYLANTPIVVGESVSNPFMPVFANVGKINMYFVPAGGDVTNTEERRTVKLAVSAGLIQILKSKAVRKDEFEAFKNQWEATPVPIEKGGLGESSAGASIRGFGRTAVSDRLGIQRRLGLAGRGHSDLAFDFGDGFPFYRGTNLVNLLDEALGITVDNGTDEPTTHLVRAGLTGSRDAQITGPGGLANFEAYSYPFFRLEEYFSIIPNNQIGTFPAPQASSGVREIPYVFFYGNFGHYGPGNRMDEFFPITQNAPEKSSSVNTKYLRNYSNPQDDNSFTLTAVLQWTFYPQNAIMSRL